MNLLKKELRENAFLGISGAVVILLTGMLLNSLNQEDTTELINPFIVLRFILAICFACILGSMTYGGDRERKSQFFIWALPLSKNALYISKTLAGFALLSLIYMGYYAAGPDNRISSYWPILLLGYATGHLLGLIFPRAVNAASLAIAINMGVYSGSVGMPFMIDNSAYMIPVMCLTALGLMGLTWKHCRYPEI